jgi:hypothetical protein
MWSFRGGAGPPTSLSGWKCVVGMWECGSVGMGNNPGDVNYINTW